MSFDVTTGKFQGQLGQLPLNQHTTLEDVRKRFPTSGQQANVDAPGQPGVTVSLHYIYRGQPTEGALRLHVEHGCLVDVAFWFPC